MTTPSKTKVLHVYRHPYAGLECNDAPEHDNYIRLNGLEYLGEYAPRGPVVAERWEVRRRGERYNVYAFEERAYAHKFARYRTSLGFPSSIVHVTTRKVCR